MPFKIIKDNFYTNSNLLTHLKLKIIFKDFHNQNTVDLPFQLQKVVNNQIYLLFDYSFTV
jgi:hypothetical protein